MSETQKRYRRGTHRVVAPETTLARVNPLRRAMGITRLSNVTGLDSVGIPVVQCIRPNSRSISVSQGKGLDLEAAAASALMESVENYHAERVELPLALGSWAGLCHRRRLADVGNLTRPTTSRFHADASLLWVEARNLLDDKTYLLPFDTVHTDYRLPYPTGSGCFSMSSNGLASGNHPQEALLHALCELIERDAVTLAAVAPPISGGRVMVDSIDAPDCVWLLDRFDQAGIDVSVWDVTSDLGLPTYKVSIADRNASDLSPAFGGNGSGCHPDREIALIRALAEAAQSRVTCIAASRDDGTPDAYALGISPSARRSQAAAGSLDADTETVRFSDRPSIVHDSVDEDVEWALDALTRAGIEQVLVVDLTRPEFRIPVVRAVVPGLESGGQLADTTYGRRAERAAAAAAQDQERTP